MNLKNRKWLVAELPGLVEEGVLSESYAAALRAHYEPSEVGKSVSPAFVICGVLGALLIGGGIILLFGHNWNELSRPFRTVLSLLPLLLSQAAGAWGLWRGWTSRAWREPVALFISLAAASSIALIGQTYHIPGDLTAFLLVWMLLTLPLVYLFRAVTPALIYLAGITAWAASSRYDGGSSLPFWLLYGGLFPFAWRALRDQRFSSASAVLGWGLCAQSAWIGVLLERSVPGLWIIVYAGVFALLYLVGSYAYAEAPSGWSNPFSTVGAAGSAVLALVLTNEWAWKSIGWHHLRDGADGSQAAFWVDLVLVLAVPAAALVLLVTSVRRGQPWRIPAGVAPVVAVVGYVVAAAYDQEWAAMLLFNLYVFAFGLAFVIQGVRERRLVTMNGGMAVLSALLLLRFFDDAMSMAVRGVVFILLGGGFLAANWMLIRRGRNERW